MIINILIFTQCQLGRAIEKPLDKITNAKYQNGNVMINVPAEEMLRFKANGFVRNRAFGITGDGKTDNMIAIAKTHETACRQSLSVKPEEGAFYYIRVKNRSAVIQPNINFGRASFFIDDTDLRDRSSPVIMVISNLQPFSPEGISDLKRNQEKINITFPNACLVTVYNSNGKSYINWGENENISSAQTDIFNLDKNGNSHKDAPNFWNFVQITEIDVLHMNYSMWTITNGCFTSIANNEKSKYNYHSRRISIRRTNIFVNGIEHHVFGEGDHGDPYSDFNDIKEKYI